MTPSRIPVVLAALVLAACAREDAGPARSAAPAAPAPSAAASADGTCAEHGVLAAVCTKCNPALAAVFQAKGDWCAEHGFPESFCPQCRPERGGKPVVAGDLAAGEAPADGLVVRLKGDDAERLAGIRTAVAETAPAEDVVVAVARVEAGPRHRAEVAARAEAVVARLLVDVGDAVREGQPLAALEGPAGEMARARVSAAEARAARARADLERERSLRDRGISAARDVLVAEEGVAEAEGELAAARAALGLVGGPGQRVVAPLSGVVTRRVAVVGQLVQPGDVLFEVADLSGIDAVADVREELLGSIAPGRPAQVLVIAAAPEPFAATVESVAPTVDPLTRTGQVRLHVDNPLGLLRPGMAAEARLVAASRPDAVLVPREAVQPVRGVHLAFVRTSPGVYETRRVRTGSSRGERVEILAGVRAGESVATTGSYLLKTETLPGAIGSGCCEIEGAEE